PLRERKDDIIPLAKILSEKHAHGDANKIDITPQLQQALLVHDWPGNVRELENMIRKLVVLRDPQLISRDLNERAARRSISVTPSLSVSTVETVPVSAPILEQVRRAKHQAETEAILAALTSTQWNRKKAATLRKIDYKALLYKMKKLGIESNVASLPPGEEEYYPLPATEQRPPTLSWLRACAWPNKPSSALTEPCSAPPYAFALPAPPA